MSVLASTHAGVYHRDMSRDIRVHFLPELFDPDELRGGVAVVIDALRATTTIVQALSNGAEAVIPVGDVEEAREIASKLDGSALLGGERAGVKIHGFHLDNSPLAYSRAAVGGKVLVFTTTNGTRALLRASQANRILIGSFTNLNSVVETVSAEERPVHIVCAGTDGHISAEDVLCAGAIVYGVVVTIGRELVPNDETEIARQFFQARSEGATAIYDAIRASRGGRNLMELGYDADIRHAASCNLHSIVPEYDPSTNRICGAASSRIQMKIGSPASRRPSSLS